jgi:hypothetical protein
MRSRFACPNCKSDLNDWKPSAYPRKWYKLISRHTLKCPYCGAEIANRFEDVDIGLLTVATTGGLVSLWGAGTVVLPVLAVVVVGRLLIGRLVPKYVLVDKKT